MTSEQRKLAEENIYLAHYITHRYHKPYNIEFAELLSICYESLCLAACSYNSDKAKFSTYACAVMKNNMYTYMNKRKNHVNIDEVIGFLHEPSPSDIIIKTTDVYNAALKTLRNFKGTQREKAIAINFIRNPFQTQAEMAIKVGVCSKTASTALSKFRKQMKETMQGVIS